MKKRNIAKNALLAVSIVLAFLSAVSYAFDVHSSSDLIKVQPSAVYHAIRGRPLADTLAQVAQRSGITFKVNTDLGNDIVSQSIAADNWNSAVRSLLVNYNFTTIQDRDTIKTVIISGRSNDAATNSTPAAAVNSTSANPGNIIVIAPKPVTLPEKYRNFPAGSVTAVTLPVTTMMNAKNGATIALDLPMGQFNVAHDNTVNEGDGSKTWVGHLSDEGEGYRVFLSQGAGGTMGIVTTPDGTYNIELDKTGTYLIDTGKLQHAGYEGDSVMPSETTNDAKTPPTPTPGTSATTTPAATGTSVVDLMVVYTTAGQTADYAKQRITLLVTASNQAYIDSGINMKLRLVYTEPTTYVDNNSNSQALTDLANDRGAFAGISQKRAQYGADLVFLFRPLYAQTSGSCGTTYVEFAQSGVANKSLGYGTIGDGGSKDTLKNYYCPVSTFAHEIGHSLGLVHDREYSNFTGVFDYSYAWGVQGAFATIMSYKQPVLMYFSSPALATKCAGQPCGYSETDTARSSDQVKSVNYTAPLVANFMDTMVSVPVIK